MYKSSKAVFYCSFMATLFSISYGQSIHFVANSDSPEATAYNNSHKVALKSGEGINDTINVVFQSSDSVYIAVTTNSGYTWSTPVAFGQGISPAIDVNLSGFRHVAWQSLDNEIYYDCLDDWAPPVNVSQSAGMSTLPDLVADSSGVIHVVWVEQIGGYDHIYYRTAIGGGVSSDTVRISGYGSPDATCNHPSISIFHPGYRLYALWECYDPQCYSPYQIHLRYKEGTVWDTTRVWANYSPMRHPSIDYAHGQVYDTLSFCYEDSTSGNMEATFYGGNGGGYQTQGNSTYPVVSTVGSTWSYLFWQEESAGSNDIYFHLYYFNSGWSQGTLTYPESVRYPSVCGAYVVWTQGDSDPYSIYLADFGYPIGIAGAMQEQLIALTALPNPFSERITLIMAGSTMQTETRLRIYDSSGRLVTVLIAESVTSTQFMAQKNQRCTFVWNGLDDEGEKVPAGIYWCCPASSRDCPTMKVIKIN